VEQKAVAYFKTLTEYVTRGTDKTPNAHPVGGETGEFISKKPEPDAHHITRHSVVSFHCNMSSVVSISKHTTFNPWKTGMGLTEWKTRFVFGMS
jgi:hypothetical protein